MKIKRTIFILSGIILTIIPYGCGKSEEASVPVSDTEGNSYKTVKIGTQTWMAENLKATRYNDGTSIPQIKGEEEWSDLTEGAYCWYNNEEALYKDTFGALYNGYAIATGKICPVGWHIPAVEEMKGLRESLGDSLKAGGKLKEAGTVHWLAPNKGADNSSGFTALPAGVRYFEGTFSSVLSYTSFWTVTKVAGDELWYAGLYYADAALILDHRNKKHGFSIRCLKD
jgi:uncharacterized protein (TIGR02145 family)